MTYMISPMWFYWISVINNVIVAFQMVAFISGIALLCCILFIIFTECEEEKKNFIIFTDYEEEKKNIISIIKLIVPVFVISVFGIILIPTRDVLIEMQVAKFATTENAQWTLDAIKSAVDYIIQAIEQM